MTALLGPLVYANVVKRVSFDEFSHDEFLRTMSLGTSMLKVHRAPLVGG